MIDTCPLCKAERCIDIRCYRNTEFYGSQIFNVPCVHCGQMLRICASRIVRITSIIPSENKQSDFGPNR